MRNTCLSSASATAIGMYACWFVNYYCLLFSATDQYVIEIYFACVIVTRCLQALQDNYMIP